CDPLPLLLQPFDRRGFVAWENFRKERVQTKLAGDISGRGAVVARQHRDADSHRLQVGDSLTRFVSNDVGECDNARQPVVDDRVDDRLALCREAIRFRWRLEADVLEQGPIPEGDRVPFRLRAGAFPGEGGEVDGVGEREAPRFRVRHDRLRDDVLRVPLYPRGEPEDVGLGPGAEWDDVRDAEPARRQSARLVKQTDVQVPRGLEDIRVANQEATLRALRL